MLKILMSILVLSSLSSCATTQGNFCDVYTFIRFNASDISEKETLSAIRLNNGTYLKECKNIDFSKQQ